MKILVTSVDMYGLNGRERHPEPEDVGTIGFVVGIETELMEDDGIKFEDATLVLFTCELSNGRRVELAEFEVEMISEVKYEILKDAIAPTWILGRSASAREGIIADRVRRARAVRPPTCYCSSYSCQSVGYHHPNLDGWMPTDEGNTPGMLANEMRRVARYGTTSLSLVELWADEVVFMRAGVDGGTKRPEIITVQHDSNGIAILRWPGHGRTELDGCAFKTVRGALEDLGFILDRYEHPRREEETCGD